MSNVLNTNHRVKLWHIGVTLLHDLTRSLYIPPHVCVSLQELITCMLQVEVEQRYTALQVLDHPWVNVSIYLLL